MITFQSDSYTSCDVPTRNDIALAHARTMLLASKITAELRRLGIPGLAEADTQVFVENPYGDSSIGIRTRVNIDLRTGDAQLLAELLSQMPTPGPYR